MDEVLNNKLKKLRDACGIMIINLYGIIYWSFFSFYGKQLPGQTRNDIHYKSRVEVRM